MEGKESLEKAFAQLRDEQKERFGNCQNMDSALNFVAGIRFVSARMGPLLQQSMRYSTGIIPWTYGNR